MSMTKKLAIAGILSGACLAVHAAPVTYLAADNNVTTLAQMVNSTAAAASFLSVVLHIVDLFLSMHSIRSNIDENFHRVVAMRRTI